jgi:hypothetical protein
VDLKNMLGQIETNGRDFRKIGDRLSQAEGEAFGRHERRSFRWVAQRQPSWHSSLQSQMPVRAPS